MAKIALIFLFAFCVFQIATAARIPRDTNTQTTELQNALEQAMSNFKELIEKNINKDTIDKFGETMKQFGDQVVARGKEIAQQADEGFKKLQAENKQ